MVAIKIAKTAARDISELTLKAAPARLLTFLQGMADPAVRAKFGGLNWSEDVANDAWALLEELKAASVIMPPALENPTTEAITACEHWQSTGLVRARAMLQMTHPEQALFLFHDFEPAKGMTAVLNVATFLQRREALAHDGDRKASRKSDAEALAIIEHTGTTKDTIKQLASKVATAHSVPEAMNIESITNEVDAARLEALRKIQAWITAWSEMARTVVTRRDQLIKLGIAKRRARKAAAVVTPPVVVPPVVTPPVVAPVVTPPAGPSEDNGPESRAA